MMIKNYLLAVGVSVATILTPAAFASESEAALMASCLALGKAANSEAGQLCELYQQGYIAGALATDLANAEELARAGAAESEFMKRALRTRVGSRDAANSPTIFLHFCLPDDQPIDNVISTLRSHLIPDIDNMAALNKVLYGALRVEYPCN